MEIEFYSKNLRIAKSWYAHFSQAIFGKDDVKVSRWMVVGTNRQAWQWFTWRCFPAWNINEKHLSRQQSAQSNQFTDREAVNNIYVIVIKRR